MNEVLPMLDGDRPAKRPRVTLDRPTRGMPLALLVTIVCHAVYNSLIMLALRYLPLPSGLLPA